MDYYDEKIYRITDMKMKNLDQLEDCDHLVKQKSGSHKDELSLERKIVVKMYAPKTFEAIRKLHSITDQHLIESLEPSKNIKQIQNSGEGAGASGSFFFFASDKRFIMKTMSKKEIGHFLRVLPKYYEHLDTNKSTYIARMYGIFSVKIDAFDSVHVMIMQNSLPNIPRTKLAYVFDMKGSTINREELKKVSSEELKKSPDSGGHVLKDLDYVRLKEMRRFMKMPAKLMIQMVKTINQDTKFL